MTSLGAGRGGTNPRLCCRCLCSPPFPPPLPAGSATFAGRTRYQRSCLARDAPAPTASAAARARRRERLLRRRPRLQPLLPALPAPGGVPGGRCRLCVRCPAIPPLASRQTFPHWLPTALPQSHRRRPPQLQASALALLTASASATARPQLLCWRPVLLPTVLTATTGDGFSRQHSSSYRAQRNARVVFLESWDEAVWEWGGRGERGG